MTETKKGRKPKEDKEKVKQKSVYVSDVTESKILKSTKTKTLTEALLTTISK